MFLNATINTTQFQSELNILCTSTGVLNVKGVAVHNCF